MILLSGLVARRFHWPMFGKRMATGRVALDLLGLWKPQFEVVPGRSLFGGVHVSRDPTSASIA